MSAPLLAARANKAIDQFVAKPSHALLIVAPIGAGKTYVAQYVASKLLGVGFEKLDQSERYTFVTATKSKSISIEQVRDIIHNLMLKLPDPSAKRVVVIEHAETMTTQAQNALLKTIEEPPAGTILILTTPDELSILPTIRSRTQVMQLQLPSQAEMSKFFASQGFSQDAIKRALMMSDGLPGLAQALLTADNDHPLVAATARARDILQKTAFERIVMVDELTKEKDEWLATLTMLQRMAQVSLRNKQITPANAQKWHKILSAAYEAYGQTAASAQVKLVALNCMLSM